MLTTAQRNSLEDMWTNRSLVHRRQYIPELSREAFGQTPQNINVAKWANLKSQGDPRPRCNPRNLGVCKTNTPFPTRTNSRDELTKLGLVTGLDRSSRSTTRRDKTGYTCPWQADYSDIINVSLYLASTTVAGAGCEEWRATLWWCPCATAWHYLHLRMLHILV